MRHLRQITNPRPMVAQTGPHGVGIELFLTSAIALFQAFLDLKTQKGTTPET